jgi:serine phosphatase RsbU (regulator of sigma subunit)
VSIVKAIVSTTGKDISSPGYVVQIINSTLANLTPDDSYVTLFYGVINLKTGKMLYSLAGHPSPIVHNRTTGSIEPLKTNGGLVGIFDFEKFDDSEYTLKSGDRLFIYTDGLIEATVAKGREQFGKERVIKALMEKKDLPPRELTEYLHSNFVKFTGGEPLADDITILLVDYDR